jgi:8-oxo-dGTP pyrophosphatase MutT (NUDIX family)
MPEELSAFLARHEPAAREVTVWHGGQLQLAVSSYLCAELPPLELVTSVRCVVLRGDSVMVVRDPRETHILPGGRREPGESLEETLERELLEETGWQITEAALLGFRHLRHLTPRPAGYRYPFPEFFQNIYCGSASAWTPGARHPQDDVLEVRFLPAGDLHRLELPPGQQQFLEAALRARAAG